MNLSGDYIEEEKVRVIANELGWLCNEWHCHWIQRQSNQ